MNMEKRKETLGLLESFFVTEKGGPMETEWAFKIRPSISSVNSWVRELEHRVYLNNLNDDLGYAQDIDFILRDLAKKNTAELSSSLSKRTIYYVKLITQLDYFSNDGESDSEDDSALIPCKKCAGKTSWRLEQTRSADEPMTLFVTCRICKHSWKM